MPPDEKEPSLLDAVSAGIDTLGETPAPAGDPPDDADTGETDESGAAPVGEGEEPAEGEEGDADGEGDADADATEGAKGDAKGKKPAEGAAELGPDGKPKPPAAKKEDPKPDPVKERDAHVNGPVDQRLKEGTRTRIQFLANEVKRQDTLLGQADEMVNAIESTGMQADEFATMLGYAHARHKGTPEQKQKAFDFLKSELRAFALEMGHKDTIAVDFMEEHPDLKEAVANNTITSEHAQELAVSRTRAKAQNDTTAASTAATQAQQAYTAGVQALGDVAGALAKRDGDAVFLAKKTTLTAVLKPVLAELPPDKWAAAFQRAYEAMPKPVIAPPKQKAAVQNPQRPGTPAGGGGKKEPKSLFDAISAAVDGDDE